MPIDLRWQDEDRTVLKVTLQDPWDWKDFHKSMRVAAFWLDRVDHRVEIVIDFRESQHLPAGALGHIRSLGKAIHPNMQDRLIMIGLDESIARPLGGATGVYSNAERLIRFVDKDEDAQAIIALWQDEKAQ